MKLDELDVEAVEKWLIGSCFNSEINGDDSIKANIDLVERALELLRIKHKYLENNYIYQAFIQGSVNLRDGKLEYVPARKLKSLGSGTSPVFLQSQLLVFLLLNHEKTKSVFDIIASFIREIWDYLRVEDFKKTQTGVIRCYTNTRFAALTLRNYGLLKFTKNEAFKTWTLSLSGYLVASRILGPDFSWDVSAVRHNHTHDLHGDILNSSRHLSTYPNFVHQLYAICDPHKADGVFKTFKDLLERAYNLLIDYWKIINDQERSKASRQKESKKKIDMLENHLDIEEFYKEFATCLYVKHYISKLLKSQ